MNIPVRTKKKTEINNRRKLVAQYTLNRLDQTDIAEKLGVTQGTISNDLKALNKQWLEAAQDDISQIKARELAELDFMELDAAITIQKLKKDGDYSKALRYAGHRLDIKRDRAKMLGLYEPEKVELDANIKGELEGARELLQSTIAGIASRFRAEELLDQTEQQASDSS
ncbi:MAG: HTH domain-containing protein [Proteiniphilum sp.]|nr:HTH domain-containing protein [Proteiniphilum sp.]